MKVTRRDLLVWSAGAAAGLLATPVPWKVLDDVSIWSQNWPWIPQPARGPVDVKQSVCTLCPKGCGLRLRMAGGWPVGVAGSITHPVTRGALCPLAFAAHQLNWHPQRLRNVRHRSRDSSWEQAREAFIRACQEGPVTIVDGYPGRAASVVFENFAKKHGSYVVAPSRELRSLAPYESWTGVPARCLGYDFDNAKTIVSFGAQLLDGWGSPGMFSRLWADRTAGMTDPQLRLIQIDASLTRTAARAWRWIEIHEGSESALASGLARALLEQNLVPAHGPVPSAAIGNSAARTGLTADEIRELARTIVEMSPAMVVSADNNPSVAALNVLLGSVGVRGGIIRTSTAWKAAPSAHIPIQNARAVVIDGSVSWDYASQTDAEVFRFAAWDGGPTQADWLLPAPGFLEELTDVPTAPGCSLETYALAPSLVKPTFEARSTASFLASYDASLGTPEKIIDARCEDLLRQRTGLVCGADATPIKNFASAQKLKEQLWNGAVWVGEAPRPGTLPCDMKEWPADGSSLVSERWTTQWAAPVLPPLAAKLYLESSLREAPDRGTA
jgi:anaerobic selenocysteine-containing dehydrogenase